MAGGLRQLSAAFGVLRPVSETVLTGSGQTLDGLQRFLGQAAEGVAHVEQFVESFRVAVDGGDLDELGSVVGTFGSVAELLRDGLDSFEDDPVGATSRIVAGVDKVLSVVAPESFASTLIGRINGALAILQVGDLLATAIDFENDLQASLAGAAAGGVATQLFAPALGPLGPILGGVGAFLASRKKRHALKEARHAADEQAFQLTVQNLSAFWLTILDSAQYPHIREFEEWTDWIREHGHEDENRIGRFEFRDIVIGGRPEQAISYVARQLANSQIRQFDRTFQGVITIAGWQDRVRDFILNNTFIEQDARTIVSQNLSQQREILISLGVPPS